MISVTQINRGEHRGKHCRYCGEPAYVQVKVHSIGYARERIEDYTDYCRTCARDLSEKLKAYHDGER